MSEWVSFEKGTYRVELAFLVAPDHSAVALIDPMIEVYQGHLGKRQVKGRCFVPNLLVVELLEENDALDLLIDLGGEFKYRIQNPDLVAGKVFSPGIKSALQFALTEPWRQVPIPEFETILLHLTFLTE